MIIFGWGNSFTKDFGGVIKKWLATFEVNPLDRSKVFRLLQDVANILQRHRALLPGAAPGETMITLKGALIGHEHV